MDPTDPPQRVIKIRRDYNTWVADETIEDYALRFTPRAFRKWSVFRVANTAKRRHVRWDAPAVSGLVDEILQAFAPASLVEVPDQRGSEAIFLVGMPRSGSTLVADQLARHRDVRYRGELVWLPHVAQQVAQTARPSAAQLESAAATYRTQVRQDDAPARFYLDKQPLNFLHLDLIASLFPNARVIHCVRNERDTALSIWMQYFAGSEENFAYDFADIATVMQSCDKLMAHAKKKGAVDIRTVSYERLATDTAACVAELAQWLGLEGDDAGAGASTISTSSLWQVRQPVYTRAIGRWRAYAPYVPELASFSPGES